MEIGNLRIGFNNNSSSTHSMIIVNNDHKYEDELVEDFNYGWDFFTLATLSAKKKYMATMLYENIVNSFGEIFSKIIVKGITGVKLPNYAYIDHQSRLCLPKEYHTNFVSKDFFDDFMKFVENNKVLILGGNDNVNDIHPLKFDGETIGLNFMSEKTVCRNNGDFYSIINMFTGNKVRFSFKDGVDMSKTSYPESADIKITNKCSKLCQFCYQDSKVNGKSIEDIWSLVSLIKELKLLEVAIGGGEPTECKDFINIINSIKSCENIVISMTTGTTKWLNDDNIRNCIFENINSLAFSPWHYSDIVRLMSSLNVRGIYTGKYRSENCLPLYINYAYGTNFMGNVEGIIKACEFYQLPMTILGFKNIGRGINYKTQNNDGLLKLLIDSGISFGIDTVMANLWKEDIEKLDIPRNLYYLNEGKYNIYLDMVEKKFGKSSFDELQSFEKRDGEFILKEYRKW